DVVARSLIQQRERLHDLAYKNMEETVIAFCPENVHPDEWDLQGLEKAVREQYGITIDLREASHNVDKVIDQVWQKIEALLTERERQFGLYIYLFYVRQFYLTEIDEQWIAHLKNIEHLRTGIGLMGYATRDPKNEYKIRGYNLFKEMWETIERTVL